jgi:hypothetical protein
LLNEFDLKTFNFKIDRAAKTCFTPRRNTQVEDVVTFTASVSNWAESVIGILFNRSFSVQTDYASDLFQTQSIFDPVVALFDEDETKAKVMVTDANKLLEHSKQTLAAKVNKYLPPKPASSPFMKPPLLLWADTCKTCLLHIAPDWITSRTCYTPK